MIIPILILLTAFPVGYLLALLTREEILGYRKYFITLAVVSAIIGIIFIFLNLTVSLSLFYILIISLISVWKSYDLKNF